MTNRIRRDDVGREDVLKGAVAGLIGGLAGSWTMNQFQALVTRAGNRSQQAASGDDEDATQKLAQKIATTFFDRRLSKNELRVAGPVVHYAYGGMMGAVYGALADRSERIRSLAGAGYGLVLWGSGDEIGVPLLGLSRPSTEYPLSTHAQALAGHIVYGVTTELVRRGVRRLAA